MTSENNLRVGIFGTGMMGRNHIKTAAEIKGVSISGVYDVIPTAAEKAAFDFKCKAFNSPSALADEIDCAIVATTSVNHAETGLMLLEKGVHCLIEKPFATTEDDCLKMIKKAEEKKRILMVGHIEHFNPAVAKLREIAEKGLNIKAIETRRMSKASGRITDVDVAMDLMIHDLEIILRLAKSPVVDVHAVSYANGKDYITALISFANGVIANATASRITSNRIRTLSLTAEEAHFDLDFINQKLAVNHQGRPQFTNKENIPAWADFNVEVASERIFIANAQALYLEQENFFNAIRKNTAPAITGEDALNALRVIWTIQKKLNF